MNVMSSSISSISESSVCVSALRHCLLVAVLYTPSVLPICYDQSPFWFLGRPTVENLLDEEGRIMSNKVRVKWGALHNFKCVDYFLVEYFNKGEVDSEKILTPRIERFKRFFDIDVDPCTEYAVKVIASEDYQGKREDFKAVSGEVSHKVDYTPRFISKPKVQELKIRENKGRNKRWQNYGWQNDEGEEEEDEAPQPVMLRISWRLAQIDYPTCLDYFVLDYYDITYNESTFSRTIQRPFPPRIQYDIHSDSVPCDPEFRYILRVMGLTGAETRASWTPPSCIMTTPAPTTTQEPGEKRDETYDTLYSVLAENDQLRAKIEGLNEEYAKIGLEVFNAFSDDVFTGIEKLIAIRHEIKANESAMADSGWG